MCPAAQWQVGVDIQRDRLRAVAVQHRRYGWQLRGWWEWPVSHHSPDDTQQPSHADVVSALAALRLSLPYGYRIRVGIPTGRTLQQQMSLPAMAMTETDTCRYIGQMAAQQLDIPVSQLCWDYVARTATDSGSKSVSVATAPADVVARLQEYFTQSKCHLRAITPDALALAPYQALLGGSSWVIYRSQHDWLWYGPQQWGATRVSDVPEVPALLERLGCKSEHIHFCGPQEALTEQPQERLDPYRLLHLVAPPLPENIDPFVIALGLALGGYPA
jgi:pilus assembly protein HofM